MDTITKCTRPGGMPPDAWTDCERCHVAACGYSGLMQPNPYWREQGGCCEWEHCIENQPIGLERTEKSCPVFGHDCPGGIEKVAACRADLDREMGRSPQTAEGWSEEDHARAFGPWASAKKRRRADV